MGIVLCKTKENRIPYVIKKVGVKIYSLEELCYYIYNNIYLIDDTFVNDSLVDYIETFLGEESIAKGLKRLMSNSAPVAEKITFILRNVDFYSPAEINELSQVITHMASKDIKERLLAMADNYLVNNCMKAAIDNYNQVLEMSKHDHAPKIYHNMGVAYAKLFDYRRAYECFKKAYEYEKNEKILEAMYKASIMHKLSTNEQLIDIPPQSEEMLMNVIERMMDDASMNETIKSELETIDGNSRDEIDRIIDELKKSYEYML